MLACLGLAAAPDVADLDSQRLCCLYPLQVLCVDNLHYDQGDVPGSCQGQGFLFWFVGDYDFLETGWFSISVVTSDVRFYASKAIVHAVGKLRGAHLYVAPQYLETFTHALLDGFCSH